MPIQQSEAIHGLYGQLFKSNDGVTYDNLVCEVGDFNVDISSDQVEVTNRNTSQDNTTLVFWKQRIYGPNDSVWDFETNYLEGDAQLDYLLEAIVEQVPIYLRGVGVVGAGKRQLEALVTINRSSVSFPKGSQSLCRFTANGASPVVMGVQS